MLNKKIKLTIRLIKNKAYAFVLFVKKKVHTKIKRNIPSHLCFALKSNITSLSYSHVVM